MVHIKKCVHHFSVNKYWKEGDMKTNKIHLSYDIYIWSDVFGLMAILKEHKNTVWRFQHFCYSDR